VSYQPSSNLLGFCTLSTLDVNASSPRSDYIKDGCNVLAATTPGGPLTHFNRGGTTAHEVGPLDGAPAHISGESCAPNDGHYIADTPLQYVPTDGCHRWKDSCPVSPGLDAIHNFMNNTSDDCTRALLRTRLGECGACGPQ